MRVICLGWEGDEVRVNHVGGYLMWECGSVLGGGCALCVGSRCVSFRWRYKGDQSLQSGQSVCSGCPGRVIALRVVSDLDFDVSAEPSVQCSECLKRVFTGAG